MSVLVGKNAPDFTAQAVFGDNTISSLTLSEYSKGKYTVLFFYPLNFTFVCPSEIIAFNNKLDEFKNRNAQILGISVDSQFSHLAYKGVEPNAGGIGNIAFPLISDLSGNIAREYDVLNAASVALRGAFLIDTNGIVRHQVVNDLPLGRNVDEMLRMLDALQHFEQHGEVCPANWNRGKDAMTPTKEGVASYLAKNTVNQ